MTLNNDAHAGYRAGDTVTIVHEGVTHTGVCAWRQHMPTFNAALGAYSANWYLAVCNAQAEVPVAAGPMHVMAPSPHES